MNRIEHAVRFASELVNKDSNPKADFVYVIECRGFIKAGVARDVKRRLCMMQTGCPYELKVLVACQRDNAYHAERVMHDRLKAFHVRGEWFQPPDEVLKALLYKLETGTL